MLKMASILLGAALSLIPLLTTTALALVEDYTFVEFPLSEKSSKIMTIPLPPQMHGACHFFFIINATDSDSDGTQSIRNETENGEIIFTVKHPDLEDGYKEFKMTKHKGAMGLRNESFCFIKHCKNISQSTLDLYASTDLTSTKDIKIMTAQGNDECITAAPNWVLWTDEIIGIIILVSILAIIIVALLLINPRIIQEFLMKHGIAKSQNIGETHKKESQQQIIRNSIEENCLDISAVPQEDEISKVDEATVLIHEPNTVKVIRSKHKEGMDQSNKGEQVKNGMISRLNSKVDGTCSFSRVKNENENEDEKSIAVLHKTYHREKHKLLRENSQKDDEIVALKNKMNEHKKLIKTMKADVEAKKDQKEKDNETIKQLEMDAVNKRELKEKDDEIIKKIEKDVETKGEQIKKFEKEKDEHEKNLKAIQEDSEIKNEQIKRYQKDVDEHQKTIQILQKDAEAKNEQMEKDQKTIKRLNENLKLANNEIEKFTSASERSEDEAY